MKRSPTKIQPRWEEILEELAATAIIIKQKPLSVCLMPCDQSTRWNSTYELLNFAYLYHEAIDKLTGDHTLNLREYELLESEWESVKRLRDSLLGPYETWLEEEWKLMYKN